MKKNLILIFTLLSFTYTAYSSTYRIDGLLKRQENFRFAYIFSGATLKSSVKIVNRKFSFTGKIPEIDRFGSLPEVTILLSADSLSQNEINEKRLLSQRKHHNCSLFLTDYCKVFYDPDQKMFTIEGGNLNRTQNLFLQELASYRNTRDSIFNIISSKNLTKNDETEQKIKVQMKLFTRAMYGFISIVKKFPDQASLANFSVIIYDQGVSVKDLQDAFKVFPIALRESKFGMYVYKDLNDRIKAEEALAKPPYSIGMKFLDFELADRARKLQKGTALLGKKYTLIDFWATWCGPCRNETPNVIRAFNRFNPKGFKVVTISIDDSKDYEKWLTALQSDGMESFVNLFNGNDMSGLARELKVVAIPMNYLLDDKGNIVAMNLRGEQLTKKLEELLSGSSN